MPLPTQHVRSCADDFIVRGAGLIGEVISIPDMLSNYRVHGENAWYGTRAPKSREFIGQLEIYLNQKLVEAGKAPGTSTSIVPFLPKTLFRRIQSR